MALTDEISKLRDETLKALEDSHNYYSFTRKIWRSVQSSIKKGQTLEIRNLTTGSIVKEDDLSKMSQLYVTTHLPKMTFLHFVSQFEFFISDFLRLWLVAFPQSLSTRELKFEQVLNSLNRDEIIRSVVWKVVADLAYDSVSNWFEFVEKRANLGCPDATQIGRIAEMKATRDLLAHNNGVANDLYCRKSGKFAKFEVGKPVEIRDDYLNDCWNLIKQVVSNMSDSALKKRTTSREIREPNP